MVSVLLPEMSPPLGCPVRVGEEAGEEGAAKEGACRQGGERRGGRERRAGDGIGGFCGSVLAGGRLKMHFTCYR